MNRYVALGLAVLLVPGLVALTPGPALADQSEQVVVTRPGVVFHRAGSDDVRGRGFEKPIDMAIESGYTPCRVCFGKDLGSIPSHTPEIGSGAAVASFGLADIPAPPVNSVAQPFGVRLPTGHTFRLPNGVVRNPYEFNSGTVTTGEQGAFEGNR